MRAAENLATGKRRKPEIFGVTPSGLKLAPATSIPGAGEQGVVVTDIDPTGVGAD